MKSYHPLGIAASLILIGTLPARAENTPTVMVAEATRQNLFKPLTIQAEFRPYQEVELHAKVSGFLQEINVDFGDRVKTGEKIATLEVPELKDDLAHAVAVEQHAESDYKDAHLNFTRLGEILRTQPKLMAQQDIDTAEAKDGMAAANLAAAKADVNKYQTLLNYTGITAPFSGVVTERYADPGALIQAGTTSNTQALPLIRLSEINRLRLDFPVSITYASEIRVGDQVQIKLESDDRQLTGAISRFTHRISQATRTMEAEVEVPNPDLKLIPGMYATVVLQVQRRPHALTIPVEAVSGTDHPTVDVVDANQQIAERPVKLGLETATRFEVLSGLAEGDRVVIGGRSAVQAGEKVLIQSAHISGAQ